MELVTKNDIIKAFKNNKRGRDLLLYLYYKDSIFNKPFTCEYISEKLTEDLNYPISIGTIRHIYRKVIPALSESNNSSKSQSPNQPQDMGGERKTSRNDESLLKPASRYNPKNANEYPKKDPFNGAFDGL